MENFAFFGAETLKYFRIEEKEPRRLRIYRKKLNFKLIYSILFLKTFILRKFCDEKMSSPADYFTKMR